jgi:hypothetical protein
LLRMSELVIKQGYTSIVSVGRNKLENTERGIQ